MSITLFYLSWEHGHQAGDLSSGDTFFATLLMSKNDQRKHGIGFGLLLVNFVE